jgi:hypothetical protein
MKFMMREIGKTLQEIVGKKNKKKNKPIIHA